MERATYRTKHVRSALFGTVFLIIAGLCTTGCGDDELPAEENVATNAGNADNAGNAGNSDPDREVPGDNLLEPGTTSVTEAGVGIGAADGALEQFVAVVVEPTDDSTDISPLPPEAEARGEFYRISSGRDVELKADGPALYLAVPVPEDADPNRVALGVRVEEGLRPHLTGDQLGDVESVWTVLEGMYDPDGRLLVVPIHALSTQGNDIVIVESDDYQPARLPGEESSGTAESGLVQQPILGKVVDFVTDAVDEGKEFVEEGGETKEDFYVKCRGFDDGECDDADKELVRQHLLDVYGDFVEDFRAPDLRRTLPGRKVDGEQGRYYLYILRKDDTGYVCNRALGMYIPTTNTGVTCWDPDSGNPPSEETTRMEFFHGVQYNYAPISWTNGITGDKLWIIEGTASFVENPDSTSTRALRDPSRSLREVDVPLTEQDDDGPGVPAYEIQDFWVYMINELSSTPRDVLNPLFEQRSDTSNIPSKTKLESLHDLRGLYWGWVRNQAFEGTLTDGNDALADKCVPNSDAWNDLGADITYESAAQSDPLEQTLTVTEPMNSDVFKVTVRNTFASQPAKFDLEVEAGDRFGFVRFYRDRSTASPDCLNQGGERWNDARSVVLQPSEEAIFWVLAANATPGPDRPFDLTVSHREPTSDLMDPQVSIVKPEPTDGQEVRPVVNLLADASDPGFIESYEWTISSGVSEVTYSGNDLTVYPYNDVGGGMLDVTVLVTDDDGQTTEVTVQRNMTPGG